MQSQRFLVKNPRNGTCIVGTEQHSHVNLLSLTVPGGLQGGYPSAVCPQTTPHHNPWDVPCGTSTRLSPVVY